MKGIGHGLGVVVSCDYHCVFMGQRLYVVINLENPINKTVS